MVNKCLFCEETRHLENARIVAGRRGGTYKTNNVIKLCPTHHRCFDNHSETEKEMNAFVVFVKENFEVMRNCLLFLTSGFARCNDCTKRSAVPPYCILLEHNILYGISFKDGIEKQKQKILKIIKTTGGISRACLYRRISNQEKRIIDECIKRLKTDGVVLENKGRVTRYGRQTTYYRPCSGG